LLIWIFIFYGDLLGESLYFFLDFLREDFYLDDSPSFAGEFLYFTATGWILIVLYSYNLLDYTF
jgi:hypothetical protein